MRPARKKEGQPDISVVIPIHNEAAALSLLDSELKNVLSGLLMTYEIIYVNDGSTDSSLQKLRALQNVTVINLRRNYGQATALDAGFKMAEGNIVVTIDGDGQQDPNDIPKLIEKLDKENFDVVAGWRIDRQDNFFIRFFTVIGRFLRKTLLHDRIHDSGCTLRVYRAEAVKSLDIGGEMHRYILALLVWKGFRIGEMPVSHRPRQNGNSHYDSRKIFRGFFDLIYIWFIHTYAERPLHLFGYLSGIFFTAGRASGIWSIYEKVGWGLSLNRNGWFFVAFFFLLSSVILFSFGIMIDFLVRLHLNNSPYEKRYYIRDIFKT